MIAYRRCFLACGLLLLTSCDPGSPPDNGRQRNTPGAPTAGPALRQVQGIGTPGAPPVRTAEALALVEKAIRAHGGEEAFEKNRRMVREMSIAVTPPGSTETKWSTKLTVDLPDRFRLDTEQGESKVRTLVVINGPQGWVVSGGETAEMSPVAVKEFHDVAYAYYLFTLAPLLRDKSFHLETLPDEKLDEKTVRVVKVGQFNRPEAQLFFDADTSLLVNVNLKTAFGGFKADRAFLFGDYKTVDGLKLPMKYAERLRGNKVVEGQSPTYQFPEKFDASVFSRP